MFTTFSIIVYYIQNHITDQAGLKSYLKKITFIQWQITDVKNSFAIPMLS